MSEPTCRRCSDCIGCEHHWLEELWFDPSLSPTADPVADHVCKHCPAVGMTCEACDGEGECWDCDGEGTSEDNHDADGVCSACNGFGVCPNCNGLGIKVVPGVFTPDGDDDDSPPHHSDSPFARQRT